MFNPGDIVETDPEGALYEYYYKLKVTAVYVEEEFEPVVTGTIIKCYDLSTHPIGSTIEEVPSRYLRLVYRPDPLVPLMNSLNTLEEKLSVTL